jgi:adenylate cyclase
MAEEKFRRKLTAILSADVEGYSRLMGEDEDATIRTLTSYRELMSTLIKKHRGRVVDSPGDNLLAEFLSVVDAVRCAVEIQEELRVRNAELPENRRMEFRIGINLGDVVEEEERIYGDGINIAARVEGLAEGGGICISGTVYDSIKNKLSLSYESLGEHTVKNIKEPVRVYRMRIGPETAAPVVREEKAGPRRWQKAALAAVAVLVVVAGTWAIWNFYFRPPPIEPASKEKMAYPLPDKPSIAVLPFVNMSDDPAQEYIADGICESVITALCKIPEMFVIARTSTSTYKGKSVKIQQVSEELGVRYVLEGSVQKTGDRIRVTAQLIDAITGHHLWADRYDRDTKGFFDVLDEIARKVAIELQVRLTEGEQARMSQKTKNFEAWGYATTAYSLFRYPTKENIAKIRELAEKAIKLDPEYAFAWGVLGATHYVDVLFRYTESHDKSFAFAVECIDKSLKLDETLPCSTGVKARLHMMQGQFEQAIALGEKAIALGPSQDLPYYVLGFIMGYAGRFEEAIALTKKAMRLNPCYPANYLRMIAHNLFLAGRYEEALEAYKKTLELDQKGGGPSLLDHLGLSALYIELGREEEARTHAEEVIKINPKFSVEYLRKGIYSYYKDPAHAERFLSALRKAGLPETPPLPLPNKPSIAVLPFVNMSADPKQEYFSDGLTEEIITALSKTPKLFVIARNSSFVYKGKPVNVQQVSRELGVKYVLEGSVRRSENQLRITAQLIDATTGNHLWAERYDRELKDIFAIQDEITMKILACLQVELTKGEEARMWVRGTNDLDAYMKVLAAIENVLHMNKESNILARQLATAAIDLDPQYAATYTVLAATHMFDVWLGTSSSPKQSIGQSIALAQKALSIDQYQSKARGLLGFLFTMTGRHDEGIAEAEKAVALDPNSDSALNYLGIALRYGGRPDEAIPVIKKAIRLNPLAPGAYLFNLGACYLLLGRYEEAIAEGRKATSCEPDNLFAQIGLAAAYAAAGRDEEARATASEVLRIEPNFSLEKWSKTLVYKNQADGLRVVEALHRAGLK